MSTRFNRPLILGALIALPFAATAQGKYADVNGLHMYYEIHGKGEPLLLLHGAFSTAEGWGSIVPSLAKTRQVIVVELEGHGHTKDLERPLSIHQMAEDAAGLVKQLGIKQVDVFGYSMGGFVGLDLAAKHPELVRRLATIGSAAGPVKETMDPANFALMSSITPENFNAPQITDPYTKVAPDPSRWPIFVKKVIAMILSSPGIPDDQLKGIKSEVLIMGGDRDAFKLESLVDTYRAVPGAQLAIFPGADHFLVIFSPDKVLATLVPFLDGVKQPTMPTGP